VRFIAYLAAVEAVWHWIALENYVLGRDTIPLLIRLGGPLFRTATHIGEGDTDRGGSGCDRTTAIAQDGPCFFPVFNTLYP